jgi:CheY-like chemotaxis protein
MPKSSTPTAPLSWRPPPLSWMAAPPPGELGSGVRPSSSSSGARVEGQGPRRILVVDDDPAILKVWRRVLGTRAAPSPLDHLEKKLFGAPPPAASPDAGFAIDTASQGQEAYQMVVRALEEARPYTFALVDMRMPPGWDGLETILHMLEKDARLEVAICSAFSDISREEVAQRVGRADLLWIRKPFELEVARDLARKLSEQGVHRRQTR